ncbi:MAG: DUF1015 domain-containing protein [Lachnospiraceae bacterium]|nr:DUF1015 domain-containing protein [Lachnospiraceae bacterium]
MSHIRPFQAIRPRQEFAERIAALPYDVYDTEEARQIVSANSFSFLAIDRPEVNFPEGHDIYSPDVYEKASSLLKGWIAEGRFIKENKPCFYVYSMTFLGRTQTGIVGCFAIDDYLDGTIKKHENTREDKEIDRINHVYTCSAQTGPIFLAYRANETIFNITLKALNTKPVYEFTTEQGVIEKVYVIDDDYDVQGIVSAFDKIRHIYIADGHHRCASAVKVGLKKREENPGYTGEEEFNYCLSVLFPEDELCIMDYNRVVKDLNGLTYKLFLEKIGEHFEISESETAVKPKSKGTFGMFLNRKWYVLKAKQELKSTDPVKSLDVSILQDYVLDPILGIKNPKTDKRMDFVGGIRGLGELERRVLDGYEVAFSMHPTSMNELFAVADKDMLMPPKSTWFEPKLLSGLFIHEI